MDFEKVLGELQFSANLSQATIAKLASLTTARDFSAGTLIFAEGAENPWIYVIAAGQVALEMCIPGRGCTRILTLGAGDLLAWSPLFGSSRTTAGAHALTNVRVLMAPAGGLADLSAADHDFGYEFFRAVAVALAKRLVGTRLQLLDLYGEAPGAASLTSPPKVQEKSASPS